MKKRKKKLIDSIEKIRNQFTYTENQNAETKKNGSGSRSRFPIKEIVEFIGLENVITFYGKNVFSGNVKNDVKEIMASIATLKQALNLNLFQIIDALNKRYLDLASREKRSKEDNFELNGLNGINNYQGKDKNLNKLSGAFELFAQKFSAQEWKSVYLDGEKLRNVNSINDMLGILPSSIGKFRQVYGIPVDKLNTWSDFKN